MIKNCEKNENLTLCGDDEIDFKDKTKTITIHNECTDKLNDLDRCYYTVHGDGSQISRLVIGIIV